MTAKKAPAKRKPQSRASREMRLRERIALAYANSDIAPEKNIEGMQAILEWIKSGAIPGQPKLRVVADNGKSA